jgi:hypothetical protein
MEWIKENAEWLFSGAGLSILVFVYNRFFKDDKSTSAEEKVTKNVSNSSPKITVNTYLNSTPNQTNDQQSAEKLSESTAKIQTRILFIDDNHTDYRMVSILKKSGWMMWSGKTGLEKSQIKPEITHQYETRTKKVHQ